MRDDADPAALTIEAARERIARALPRVGERERLGTREARGRVLAVDILSPIDVPPFRASAMDGYALRHAEIDAPLKVIGRSLAGHPAADELPLGGCVRVTTGARLPDAADTVVQQENVVREGDTLRVSEPPARGTHVRERGSDSARGRALLARGTRLGARALGVLAAHGIAEVEVTRALRVALLSTGDELVEAGTALGPGQINDANRVLLEAMLAEPAVATTDLGIVADDPEALTRALDAARDADMVVSSGGVSVGETDHARAVLAARGEVRLWKIAMKPGRPLLFGRLADGPEGRGPLYFGLPGNPVSAALTALMFVRPALAAMSGRESTGSPPPLEARLSGELRKLPGRVEYQRGVLGRDAEGRPVVRTSGLQESHALLALQDADCLIELPDTSRGAGDGEMVVVHPLTHFADPPL